MSVLKAVSEAGIENGTWRRLRQKHSVKGIAVKKIRPWALKAHILLRSRDRKYESATE
jgi:hypothetical protein